jgi:hypothetical protein
MAKLLNTTYLTTQSSSPTVGVGYGALYASESGLFFKNSSGIEYNIAQGGSSGPGGSGSFTFFTSSGTWTYNTGSNIQYIKVVCAGGGGGGGSGRTSTPASGNRNGGAGGAGGNINIAYFSSQSLTTDSYTVTVGGGGPGGARITTISSTGTAGQTGNPSSFASGSTILVRGAGGPGGSGGSATNTANANLGGANSLQTTTTVPNPYPPFYYCGVDGGDSGGGLAQPAESNALGTRWMAGGGAGGAINSSNAIIPGGSGSRIYNGITLISSGSPGVSGSNGSDGAPVVDVLQLFYYSGSNITTGIMIGTGGHGGGGGVHSPATSGGNGGSGSRAAGGGGGGGCNGGTGLSSGAGGRGGDGFVIIFEYY